MEGDSVSALMSAVRMVRRASQVLESFVLHGHGFPFQSAKFVERATLVEQVVGLLNRGAIHLQMTDARLGSQCERGL